MNSIINLSLPFPAMISLLVWYVPPVDLYSIRYLWFHLCIFLYFGLQYILLRMSTKRDRLILNAIINPLLPLGDGVFDDEKLLTDDLKDNEPDTDLVK